MGPMLETVIGIDLGGTNVRAGIVDNNGKILRRAGGATPNGGSAAEIVAAAVELINELEPSGMVARIGFAVAAVVDAKNNRISRSPNLPQLDGVDLSAEIGSRTGAEVYLENDATAAAIGEYYFGAGRNSENMVCITLGTGVGGGLIIDGKTVYGADGNAGEIGHICLDIDGPLCGCGSNGCLEQYASGTAIVRAAKELLPEFPESPLHSRLEFSARDVYDAAIEGDDVGIKTFDAAGRRLGGALAGIVNVLNPEIIVITGGVAAGWNLFIEGTREELQKRAFQQPAERVKIVRGSLNDDAGVLGAAKRAFWGKGFS